MDGTNEGKGVVNLLFHPVFHCPLVFLQTVTMATKGPEPKLK